jgi:hypothetical protein
MRITNLKDKLPKIKDYDELWENQENFHLCVDTIRYGVQRITTIIHELENGEILPLIQEERKRLRQQNYTINESWRVAFNNRKYLIMEMLKANESMLNQLLLIKEKEDKSSTCSA